MVGMENPVDVREVKIRNFRDTLYLPPDNYYACEVLPEDWIDIIPSQRQQKSPSKMTWRDRQLQSNVSSPTNRKSPVKSHTMMSIQENQFSQQTTLYHKYNKRAD